VCGHTSSFVKFTFWIHQLPKARVHLGPEEQVHHVNCVVYVLLCSGAVAETARMSGGEEWVVCMAVCVTVYLRVNVYEPLYCNSILYFGPFVCLQYYCNIYFFEKRQ
jgi:hypothetical protein